MHAVGRVLYSRDMMLSLLFFLILVFMRVTASATAHVFLECFSAKGISELWLMQVSCV